MKKRPRMTESQLKERYPQIILGTLEFDEDAQRQSVEILCSEFGCGVRRRVFTSDLFQCEMCVECTIYNRLDRATRLRRLRAKGAR